MTQKGAIRVHNQSLRRLYFPGQCFSPLQLFSNSSCPALGRAADLFTTKYQSRHFQVFKQQDVTQKLPHHEEIAYRVEPNSTSAAKGWWAQARGTGWAWGTASFSSSTSRALSHLQPKFSLQHEQCTKSLVQPAQSPQLPLGTSLQEQKDLAVCFSSPSLQPLLRGAWVRGYQHRLVSDLSQGSGGIVHQPRCSSGQWGSPWNLQ